MSKTSDGTPAQRMAGIGGAWAEDAFIRYATKNNISQENYGFRNARLKNFRALPEFVRHTPDFACTKDGQGFLVECKGAGRGQYVNIKVEDIESLTDWDEYCTVYVFINDSDRKKVSFMCLQDLIVDTSTWITDTWHDGVSHYKIPKTVFPWEER